MGESTMNGWEKWVKGLAAAAIGGAANGVIVMGIEPATFNIGEGIGNLGTFVLLSGLVAAAMYLKQSPLPGGYGK